MRGAGSLLQRNQDPEQAPRGGEEGHSGEGGGRGGAVGTGGRRAAHLSCGRTRQACGSQAAHEVEARADASTPALHPLPDVWLAPPLCPPPARPLPPQVLAQRMDPDTNEETIAATLEFLDKDGSEQVRRQGVAGGQATGGRQAGGRQAGGRG